MKDLGAVVSFKGYYGDLAIVVAKTSYIAEDGIENVIFQMACWFWGILLQMGSVVTVPFRMLGRCPKVWWPLPLSETLADGRDPAREFTMTQSAPLMVLPDPDEFVVVQVK